MKDWIKIILVVILIAGILIGLHFSIKYANDKFCEQLGENIGRTSIRLDGTCYIDYCGVLITEPSIKYNEVLIRSCNE